MDTSAEIERTSPDSVGRKLPDRLELPIDPVIETIRFYFRGHYVGCLTAVIDREGVQLALIGRKGGHKGVAAASLRAMEREEAPGGDREDR